MYQITQIKVNLIKIMNLIANRKNILKYLPFLARLGKNLQNFQEILIMKNLNQVILKLIMGPYL